MKKGPTRGGIISDLAACRLAFAKAKIPWVITDGIILGYARENNVLAWDTDLDLGVFQELTAKEWARLFKELRGAGFSIKNLKQDFVYGRRKVKFNLWLYHKNGPYFEAFPKTTPGKKFVEKAKWFAKPQQVNFLGSTYPMPNFIVDYLNTHYGADWRTRIVKSHPLWFQEKRKRAQKSGDLWPKMLNVKEAP